VVLVVFVVYQQLETHVLQPVVMSRTVERSALTVLVSILIGVELPGLLGALLAIPVAGVLQVIFRDVYDGSRGLKPDPTTGTGEIPVSQPRPLEPAEQQPHDAPPPSTGRPESARPRSHSDSPTPGEAHRPTNAFSSVRTQLNAYPTPHLDQHSIRRYLRLP
jgi:hypothetical protein